MIHPQRLPHVACNPRRCRSAVALVLCGILASGFPLSSLALSAEYPTGLVGYTEFRTNLPGGQHASNMTMRAIVSRADGCGKRVVAEELTRQPGAWTQFAGFSPDGKQAIVGRGWESEENARWEHEHKTFRFSADGWLYDMFLVDLATGKAENVTGVERASNYNTGLFFFPGNESQLGFQAIIDGQSHPFCMDRDGRNKRDLTKDSKEFAYGFSGSPDGRRIAYHKSYKIYVADADGSHARLVETGHPFNFCPFWSEDGAHLLFLSGEHYNCHPHVVRADGTGLRRLAGRGGYAGVVELLEVADFHSASSDVPTWDAEGQSVFYTAQTGPNVELHRVSLEGSVEQLTWSPAGWSYYHPRPSPDGCRLAYGSKRNGVRQLYVMDLCSRCECQLTDLEYGTAAMWINWQPAPKH